MCWLLHLTGCSGGYSSHSSTRHRLTCKSAGRRHKWQGCHRFSSVEYRVVFVFLRLALEVAGDTRFLLWLFFHVHAGRRKESIAESDRKSTRLNSSHSQISYAVFCLKKKK